MHLLLSGEKSNEGVEMDISTLIPNNHNNDNKMYNNIDNNNDNNDIINGNNNVNNNNDNNNDNDNTIYDTSMVTMIKNIKEENAVHVLTLRLMNKIHMNSIGILMKNISTTSFSTFIANQGVYIFSYLHIYFIYM
jgi:hypothetical protein